ncbi:MAG: SLBB domain-containing protein, partial [Streptococcaceae bacterium]|nr:SLBB domain-containing protein [Streptococcaceae bacterium]
MKEKIEIIVAKIKENPKTAGGILLVLIVGTFLYSNSQHKQEVSTLDSSALTTSQSTSSKEQSGGDAQKEANTGEIVVDVKGQVKQAGLYKVPADARVDDVIRKAGGFTSQADQKSVNLAKKVKDEEAIYVAKIGENPTNQAVGSANNTASSESKDIVNINTADLTQLQTLTGVGE